MKAFRGFQGDQERQVALPESFFSQLLPLVDDLDELKVTLACWRILAGKNGPLRCVRWEELAADEALAGLDEPAVRDGLERAVARGTLLRVLLQGSGAQDEACYLANTREGRAAVSAIHAGELPESTPGDTAGARVERPNIFVLYEQAIGLLSPLVADELRDAEETYPPDWIEEAFRQAARNNVRSWAYVRKILERRARHGQRASSDGDVSEEWRRFLRGEP